MESNVRDKLAKALLKDLSSEENVRTRKQLQKARPQVLFLENLDFINDTIKELTEREHLDEDIALLEFSPEDLSKARKIAKVYQDGYIKRHKRYPSGASNIENTMGGRHLRDKFSSDFAKVENGTAFICSSFAQIGKCKKEIIDLFIKNLKAFKKDIQSKNNQSIIKKLVNTKKVRKKIIRLKQDINKPDFGRS